MQAVREQAAESRRALPEHFEPEPTAGEAQIQLDVLARNHTEQRLTGRLELEVPSWITVEPSAIDVSLGAGGSQPYFIHPHHADLRSDRHTCASLSHGRGGSSLHNRPPACAHGDREPRRRTGCSELHPRDLPADPGRGRSPRRPGSLRPIVALRLRRRRRGRRRPPCWSPLEPSSTWSTTRSFSGSTWLGFDAIVIGPGAYSARAALRAAAPRLLDYMDGGGTLIVQYQPYSYQEPGMAPYPFRYQRAPRPRHRREGPGPHPRARALPVPGAQPDRGHGFRRLGG